MHPSHVYLGLGWGYAWWGGIKRQILHLESEVNADRPKNCSSLTHL